MKQKDKKRGYVETISFRSDHIELFEQFEVIRKKENESFSEMVRKAMTEYVEKHGSGNPAFTLDQFKDPDFKVCPSFFETKNKWAKYIKNCNDKELDGIETKSDLVKSMINTERHGRRIGSNLVL